MLAFLWQDVVDHIAQFANCDLDPVLFAHFPFECLGQGLAKFDRAAGEFPQSALACPAFLAWFWLSARALSEKDGHLHPQ